MHRHNQLLEKLEKAIAKMMGSTRSWEKEHDECMPYHEENSSCFACGFLGFKRNQVMDCSLSRRSSSSSSEIEDSDSEELFEINLKEPLALDTIREDCESTVFSLDIHNCNDDVDDDDVVYVAVGNDEHSSPSMEALSWALKHAVTPSATVVCLLHVFPQVKLIPSPRT